MYPNPVNDKLYMVTDENIESISLYTITGQHLQKINNKNSIDLSNYKPETYLVKINTQYSSIVKKVLKL